MAKKNNKLQENSEIEEVKSSEYNCDLIDKIEEEYFTKTEKNKKKYTKNIIDEYKDLQKNIKTKIQALSSYQSQKNKEIVDILIYKNEEEIKKEQYASKKFNVQKFREENSDCIDQYKKISTQKKEIEEDQHIHEKKISDLYTMLLKDGMTNLEERQFKKLISVDREEFETRFDKDTQLQKITNITGYDRSYVDEVWSDYYGKGDYSDDNDFGDNFRKLIYSMVMIEKGNQINYKLELPNFNQQQKMFFVSWVNKNNLGSDIVVENITETLSKRIDFSGKHNI